MTRARAAGRHLARVLAAALAALGAACGRADPPAAPREPAAGSPQPATAQRGAAQYWSDDRLAPLRSSGRGDPFLEDTANLIPVLVEKMSSGSIDAARQARADLLQLGERALPELQRSYERLADDPRAAPQLQNVLAVAGGLPRGAGAALLMRALEQPSETLRLTAARGLQRQAREQDFERLQEVLALSAPDLRQELALALLASDRGRLEQELCGWIERGEWPELIPALMRRVADTRRPETLACFARVEPRLAGEVRTWMLAALAGGGDAAALGQLEAWLSGEDTGRRMEAAQALLAAGQRAMLPGLLRGGRDPQLRALAARQLSDDPGPQALEALQDGLADETEEVRSICLAALCARGEAGAQALALELLAGSSHELELGLRALRAALPRDAGLAERMLTALLQLHAGELGLQRSEPRLIERAIGLVPLAAAAGFLLDLARRAEGMIQGLPAHRWYVQQAGNTGPPGRQLLRAAWETEGDPLRRIDLMQAGCGDKGDEARAFLRMVLESPRASEWERLYAANLLARCGPGTEVAPLLKRAALRLQDPELRRAFMNLLWDWYGRAR